MNKFWVLLLTLILLSACSQAPVEQGGGIGGTGQTDECNTNDKKEKCKTDY